MLPRRLAMESPARTADRERSEFRADANTGSGHGRQQLNLWQVALALVALVVLGLETAGSWNSASSTGVIPVTQRDEVFSVYSEKTPKIPLGEAGDVHFLDTSPCQGLARHLEAVDGVISEDGSLKKSSRHLEAYVEWHHNRGAAPSLEEIMSLPSTSDPSAKGSSAGDQNGGIVEDAKVTVILNVFERKMLEEQIDSLFEQTAAALIEEIWVCAFGRGPDILGYAQKVVAETDHANVRMIRSDFDFKFYGRFQTALAAPSEFVWLLDEDLIPGKKYLAQLIHASGTELLGRSLLGSIGAVLPRPEMGLSTEPGEQGEQHARVLTPEFYSDQTNAVPVDSLSGQWFLRTKWLQYMWSERPATFETGADIHISHTLRKHGSIGTYVMPYNVDDDDTKGNTRGQTPYLASAAQAGEVSQLGALWTNALKTGTRMRWMDVPTSSENTHVGPSALIVLRTEDDVRSMRSLVSAYLASASPEKKGADRNKLDRPWEVFLFSPTVRCPRIAELLSSSESLLCSPNSVRVFAPTGDALDGWATTLELEQASLPAYEVVVATNLGPVLHAIKARVVVMIGDPTRARPNGMAVNASDKGGTAVAAAVERAVGRATDSYNEGLSADGQESATLITVPTGDPNYLGFLTALDPTMVAAWNKPKISIHVITNDRMTSLKRLVNSLKTSHFLGDEVRLSLHVDTGGEEEMLDYLMETEWTHGPKSVSHRIKNGGLTAAVTESFYPGDPHEYAIILEDDIEVSPAFYAWTKHLLLRYRYSSGVAHPSSLACRTTPATPLVGISLYTPRIEQMSAPVGRVDFNTSAGDYRAILSQTPSSWGSLFFPEVWTRLHTDLVKGEYIRIPGSHVNGWPDSWKKYMFSLMYFNDWYMLYPAYEQERSFSTNHAEAGVHVEIIPRLAAMRKERFTVPLFEDGDMTFWGPGSLHLPDLQHLAKISAWSKVTRESSIPPTNATSSSLQDKTEQH